MKKNKELVRMNLARPDATLLAHWKTLHIIALRIITNSQTHN